MDAWKCCVAWALLSVHACVGLCALLAASYGEPLVFVIQAGAVLDRIRLDWWGRSIESLPVFMRCAGHTMCHVLVTLCAAMSHCVTLSVWGLQACTTMISRQLLSREGAAWLEPWFVCVAGCNMEAWAGG